MNKIKLLVAEDDKIYQTIYKDGVQSDEYENTFDLTMVDNGKKAFETFQKLKPDVVVLDILMPDMTGYDVLKKIRETDKSVTIIMATSLLDKDCYEQALDLGCNGYIAKPFNENEIGEIILRYCKER